MKKTLVALSLAALTVPALAQDKKAPEPDYTISGNFGLFSDYRFRGISQTDLAPALQGGIDFAHKSGFYLGTWGSNVSEFANVNGNGMEIDFYAGYKFSIGDVGIDVGNLYYYYPDATGTGPDTNEVYVGLSYGPLSLKTSYTTTNNYFTTANADGTLYYDLKASFPIGEGLTLNAHAGYNDIKNSLTGADYSIGIAKDLAGWSLAANYVWNSGAIRDSVKTTDVDGTAGTKTEDLGKGAVVVSISKTF